MLNDTSLPPIHLHNIYDLSLALFYVKSEEVKKKYRKTALDLMDKLIHSWHAFTVSSPPKKTSLKLTELIPIVKAMVSLLKPSAKRRLFKNLACIKN